MSRKKNKKSKIKRVAVQTLGCSKNVVDSERLIYLLDKNGFLYTEDYSKADAWVINTCGFINDAKQESIEQILSAADLKERGLLKKLIVAGCLSERYGKQLRDQVLEVDHFFGVNSQHDIIKILKGDYEVLDEGGRILLTPRHYAYLKISEGCNHRCAFCAIPLIRGTYISKSEEELIAEAETLVQNGVKELVMIAQDTTYYGKDLYGRPTIASLADKLSGIDGLEWLRLMYTFPVGFPVDILEVMAEKENFCKYIDIPLQHISDPVLKAMGRGSSEQSLKNLIDLIRENVPGVTLRTTFITGFPNETEEDFIKLHEFIKEYKFDRLGVFKYSPEDETSAFELGDPIPDEVKSERLDILMREQMEISTQKNKELEGKTLKVLIDGETANGYTGRTERDAPEVDNAVIIRSNRELKPGTFADVRIVSSEAYDLYGE
ncbi:MAG: 30S ribosomal protein S12 methylthiotransferase RimO [Candidatus Kapaibacterium sp.]